MQQTECNFLLFQRLLLECLLHTLYKIKKEQTFISKILIKFHFSLRYKIFVKVIFADLNSSSPEKKFNIPEESIDSSTRINPLS